MLTVTQAAKKKILETLTSEERKGLALRVRIRGRGPGGFQYEIEVVGEDEKGIDDSIFDAGGFQVFVDAETLPNLQGSTLDFIDDPHGGGYQIDNPNPLWTDPKVAAVQEVLDTAINPAVAEHGGFVVLLDVKDAVAYIQLGGGCQGCGMADVTLKQGIEVMLKRAVPELREIVDTTDHAGGTNPYYQPAKGAGSSALA